jgi:hypothetical protein
MRGTGAQLPATVVCGQGERDMDARGTMSTCGLAVVVLIGSATMASHHVAHRSYSSRPVATSPPECQPLPHEKICQPPKFDGVVPCPARCDGSGGVGERCVVETLAYLDPGDPPWINIEAWWVVRSHLDGRWHYVYGGAWASAGDHDRSTYVLCGADCWHDIVEFGWVYSYREGKPPWGHVESKLVTNDCVSCRTPTPDPGPHPPLDVGPLFCFILIYVPIAVDDH